MWRRVIVRYLDDRFITQGRWVPLALSRIAEFWAGDVPARATIFNADRDYAGGSPWHGTCPATCDGPASLGARSPDVVGHPRRPTRVTPEPTRRHGGTEGGEGPSAPWDRLRAELGATDTKGRTQS